MNSRATAFRVGAFVIAGAIALLVLFIFLTGGSFRQGTLYETYFKDSVQGLDVGSAVKYHGVKVGQVTDMELVAAAYPPADATAAGRPVYQQVLVRFRLEPHGMGDTQSIGNAVTRGLRAQLEPQGITGLSYIDLSFANPAANPPETVPWVPRAPVIPSIPGTLAQLQDTLQKSLSTLSDSDIAGTTEQIRTLVQTLNEEVSSGDAHDALANANSLLAQLNEAVRQSDLPGTMASIRNLAGGPQTRRIMTQLDQATAQLAKASAQLPALMAASQATLNQAGETTADLQAELLPVLRDMKAAADHLRDLSAELAANPGRILAPPPPPEGEK